MTWGTRATAFAWTMHEGRLLAVLHERLGTEVWEVPGGHLEEGETFEQAAARETFEETGISVHVEDLLATCVHEWVACRQRRLILFFKARPLEFSQPRPGDAGIVRAEWVDQSQVKTESTSAFLHPLLELGSGSTASRVAPVMFRAEHRRDESGCWRPVRRVLLQHRRQLTLERATHHPQPRHSLSS